MKNKIISDFENRVAIKKTKKLPQFRTGDTVQVHYKIQEGADKAKFRIQIFEGIVTRYRKGSVESSFTVRKVIANVIGVERVFPYHSPYVDKVEVLARGAVRRARLYYLRDLSGKAARIRSRYFADAMASEGFVDQEAPVKVAAPASIEKPEEIKN